MYDNASTKEENENDKNKSKHREKKQQSTEEIMLARRRALLQKWKEEGFEDPLHWKPWH